jgi:hypothetical protein
MAGSAFPADRVNEPTARAGKTRAEPGERVIRDQEGRSMSNNDEYVGRFSDGEAPNPNLHGLHEAGVSVWLDTLSRRLLESGQFAELISD